MNTHQLKQFAALALLVVGTVLALGSFLAFCGSAMFGVFVYIVKPYLMFGVFFGFIIGLLMVWIGSKLCKKFFISPWPSRAANLIRWFLATPFLFSLFDTVIKILYGLSNGKSMDHLPYMLLALVLICSLFLWPEVRQLERTLRSSKVQSLDLSLTKICKKLRYPLTVIASFVVINLVVSYVLPPIYEYLDKQRFEAFDAKCQEASESVYGHLLADEIAIQDIPSQSVSNETYSAYTIVYQLMRPPQLVRAAQMFYENSSSVNNGSFVSVVTDVNSLSHATKPTIASSVPKARLQIRVQRCSGLDDDIRPMKFQIFDSQSNRLLAEHSTFELLLGHMHSAKNRRFTGMGAAQVSIACKLPLPRDLIARVITPNSPQDTRPVGYPQNK